MSAPAPVHMSGSITPLTVPPILPQLLERAIVAAGSAPFLGVRTATAREQSLTFEAFGVAVEHAAARLAGALRPGTRVLVQGAPGPGFAAALFAAARANVILIPLDARMASDTVERISALTEPCARRTSGWPTTSGSRAGRRSRSRTSPGPTP